MNYRNAFLILTTMLALVSCGGSNHSVGETTAGLNGNTDIDADEGADESNVSEGAVGENTGNTGGNIIRVGFLSVGQFMTRPLVPDWQLGISAKFNEFASTATQSDLIEQLTAQRTENCLVTRSSDEFLIDPAYPGPSSPEVSAGEIITISSPAGSYTTLVRTVNGNSISYTSEVPLTGASPSGLVADIPGDTFPAYSNVVIPDVAELQVNSPSALQNFSDSTPIRWVANSNGSSFIVLSFLFALESDESVSAVCTANDDGDFSLPETTISSLDLGDNPVLYSLGIERRAERVELNGSSALYITNGYTEVLFQ